MKLYDDIIITKNRAIAKSYAKINLTLDVLGRRDDGYHEVKMIMQSVNLFDTVIMERTERKTTVSTNVLSLPNDDGNIALRAARLFFEKTGAECGVKISINKNIPIAAGLAGGSGNAAAVLCGLNILCNTNLSDEKLAELGLLLGADVPFCIFGGTCLAEGIGEKLTALNSVTAVPILLVKPPKGISTAEIYREIDSAADLEHPDTDAVLSAVAAGDIDGICRNVSNIMEKVTQKACPEIAEIEREMRHFGARAAMMSGSGPTVFGVFDSNFAAKAALDYFAQKYDEVFLTHTI